MILTIVVFVFTLGLLVLVHELGHFLTAKRNGVGAEEFGFGFPPRIVGTYRDKKGKRRWVFGNKEIEEEIKEREETIYSINLIPIGGFVKITGENGEDKSDPKSFAGKSIWVRFKILFAGVLMNFVLAAVLFSFAFWLGLPDAVDDEDEVPGSQVMISRVVPESPAFLAGVKAGDELVSIVGSAGVEKNIVGASQVSEIIKKDAGKNVVFNVIHAGEEKETALTVNLRAEAPEGQGLSGIEIIKTAIVRHGPIESIWLGIKTTGVMTLAIFAFLWELIVGFFTTKPIVADVAGPVGIAVFAGQMARMGFAYVLQFAAMLSVNLAIINGLPFPALDGGRILFLMIEKIKGSPVTQKVEGVVHTVGFVLLLTLMLAVTVKDFGTFNVIEKLKNLF